MSLQCTLQHCILYRVIITQLEIILFQVAGKLDLVKNYESVVSVCCTVDDLFVILCEEYLLVLKLL